MTDSHFLRCFLVWQLGSKQLWISRWWRTLVPWTWKRWGIRPDFYNWRYSWWRYQLCYAGVLFHVRYIWFRFRVLAFSTCENRCSQHLVKLCVFLSSCCGLYHLFVLWFYPFVLFWVLLPSTRKNGVLVGSVYKEVKGPVFPTVAVHSQNEEYVS